MTLINERGFENVTVDDICKACGLSKGAFYHHFNSKLNIISGIETMLNALINDAMEECEDVKIRTRILVFANSLLSIVDKTGLGFTRQRTKYVAGGDYINEKESHAFSNYSRLKLREMLEVALKKGELIEKTPVTITTLLSGLIADWCIFNGAYFLTDKGWELTEFAVFNMVDKYCIQ